MYSIDYRQNDEQGWLSANCDFENAAGFETKEAAIARKNELEEENHEIEFRIRDNE
jgi:hypothetical protein